MTIVALIDCYDRRVANLHKTRREIRVTSDSFNYVFSTNYRSVAVNTLKVLEATDKNAQASISFFRLGSFPELEFDERLKTEIGIREFLVRDGEVVWMGCHDTGSNPRNLAPKSLKIQTIARQLYWTFSLKMAKLDYLQKYSLADACRSSIDVEVFITTPILRKNYPF